MSDREKPPGYGDSKRPGGELKGKPIQGPDGQWRDAFGEKIEAPTPPASREAIDHEYSKRFWETRALKGEKFQNDLRATMQSNVMSAADSGMLALAVDPAGITDHDREKLSAYRELAKTMGYEIGAFRFNEKSHTAIAPIKRIEGGGNPT